MCDFQVYTFVKVAWPVYMSLCQLYLSNKCKTKVVNGCRQTTKMCKRLDLPEVELLTSPIERPASEQRFPKFERRESHLQQASELTSVKDTDYLW